MGNGVLPFIKMCSPTREFKVQTSDGSSYSDRIVASTAGVNIIGVTTITGDSTYTGDINANGNIIGDDSTNISGINTVGANFYYGCGGVGSRLFQNDFFDTILL